MSYYIEFPNSLKAPSCLNCNINKTKYLNYGWKIFAIKGIISIELTFINFICIECNNQLNINYLNKGDFKTIIFHRTFLQAALKSNNPILNNWIEIYYNKLSLLL